MKNIRVLYLLAPLLFPTLVGNALAAEPVIVVIQKMEFQPQEVTVKKGGLVRWENREKIQYHSVWFENLGEPEADYFFPEEFYERRFKSVGVFPYRCGPHNEMTGVVHVVD